VPGRPEDKLGVGFIYAQYSDQVRNFDRDVQAFSGASAPARDFEANLELTYSAQIVPGMIVQPVASYVWHPSGDASRDAAVVGVRTFVRY
jgi:porin